MSREIKTVMEIKVHPSACELAECFWEMNSEEQAEFFNRLGELSAGSLPMQLQYIADHEALSTKGRRAMQLIGNYSEQAQ